MIRVFAVIMRELDVAGKNLGARQMIKRDR